MQWWCLECEVPCGIHADTKDEPNPHMKHKRKIIGIREDILNDEMKKLVRDLKRTDRAVPFKP